jgi:hypothetical protein
LSKKNPVFTPYQSPAYSNVAFQLLGYAIESITGDTFPNVLKTKVFGPLNMTHSSYSKPADSLGVIPFVSEDLWWNVSMGDLTPAGAMYASPNDLARFGRAILSHQLLTPTQTNRWLKPLTHTSDLSASVGAPWEIQRYTLPTSSYRTVDLYTKSGGLGLYTTYLIVIPDYDVGFTLNVAGSLGAISPLADLMTETLLPALEETARLQADDAFAGTYVSADGNYTFTLSTNPDAPGLLVSNFTGPTGENNMLATLSAAALLAAGHYETAAAVLPYFVNGTAAAAYEVGGFGTQLQLRLFPTVATAAKGNHRKGEQVFRAAVDVSDGNAEENKGPFSSQCISWQLVDTLNIGRKAFDRFVFEVEDGEVVAVEHPALRERFVKGK